MGRYCQAEERIDRRQTGLRCYPSASIIRKESVSAGHIMSRIHSSPQRLRCYYFSLNQDTISTLRLVDFFLCYMKGGVCSGDTGVDCSLEKRFLDVTDLQTVQ